MKIQISETMFEMALPFVASASHEVFDKMADAFDSAEEAIMNDVIGDALPENVDEWPETVKSEVAGYVIYQAFVSQLRSHDLVLTDTGFGIVGNDQVSPASTARVDALLHELTVARDRKRTKVALFMRTVDGWASSPQARELIKWLIWNPQDASIYGALKTDSSFDDLALIAPAISYADLRLRQEFSNELMDQLLDEERKYGWEPSHERLARMVKTFICCSVSGYKDGKTPAYWCEQINNYLERNIGDFVVYTDTPEYAAKHMESYRNEARDSVFFW